MSSMLGSTNGRLRELGLLACVVLLAIVVAACAASTARRSTSQQNAAISDVHVARDGDTTVVMIMGVEDSAYEVYHLEDPHRVVVELASLAPAAGISPLAVYDGLVEDVTLEPLDGAEGEEITRIEVWLTVPAAYEVVSASGGLEIRLRASDDMLASTPDGGTELDPWAITPTSEETPVADWKAPAATQLTAVEARESEGGLVLLLMADGEIESAESFTLEDPDRLVIDLAGLLSAVEADRVEVGSPYVERVRIGQHADRVRVVVDAGDGPDPFASRRIVPSAGGLVVAFGSGDSLGQAVSDAVEEAGAALMAASGMTPSDDEAGAVEEAEMADASEDGEPAMAEPAMAGAEEAEALAMDDAFDEQEPEAVPGHSGGTPTMIYGVEFDAQAERDRIVVLSEHPVDYLVYEPSVDTVVLSIQNAVIDPELSVRITPEAGGPVSLVTAFEQPEVDVSEVRIVVKRAENLKPEVSRRGSLIVMDFSRAGGVAATPPVLTTPPDQPVVTEPAAGVAQQTAASQPTAATPVAQTAATPIAVATATPQPVPPASLEPQMAISVLQEGGLMDGKVYTGRRISLDFKEIDMADVLRLIAEVSDLNVIAGDEVSGKVTIRLVDVPWDQALDVILLTKGLGFMRLGNVLRIAPSGLLRQEEEARLQERRALEQLEDLVVKLQPVNYADVKDIKGMVQRLLSPRGTVNADKRTNTIIIKDIPSVVDEATALIKAIDTQTPQVMIEAKIVEASLDFSREFGSRWGFGAQPLVDAFDPNSDQRQDLSLGGVRFHNSESSIFSGNNAQFINPLTAGPTALFNLAGFILDEKLNIELQLQAAEVNGDGKVISSPRIVTLDNHKATIEQGVAIPFQTFENGDAQLEFVDAVLKLDVTPHITADKSIIMEIEVSRNAPDDSVFTLTGSPAIAKNQVDTETLVKDGQTLVIGGIYVVDKSQRQSRVPYLHRIPLLGAAFRSDEISDSRKELLIFVTPRIVVTPPAAS